LIIKNRIKKFATATVFSMESFVQIYATVNERS